MVVDDQRATRMGLRLMIEKAGDLSVIADAADGALALEELHRRKADQLPLPDVILMDIRMPNLNGIDATDQIVREFPRCKVLALTTFDQDDYAFAMLSVGASGFLLKDIRAHALHDAVRAVASGDAILTPRVTRQLIERSRPAVTRTPSQLAANARLDELSPREHTVAGLVAQGLNNREIAERLQLQPESVKKSVTRILAKLGARDRVHITLAMLKADAADR